MAPVSFVMLGGFLGAGKTTLLSRLAKHYRGLGRRVAVITNDQAEHLVDTSRLRAQGLAVREVAGACFCCRFDELMTRVEQLEASERPDVILAEPVGSCTDLVATIIQPLKRLFPDRLVVAPYTVLFKPSLGLPLLQPERTDADGDAGPSYIFLKQLEEADAIVINRIDEMSQAERELARCLVARRYPQAPILSVSARTGEGVDGLLAFLDMAGSFGRRILDLDYDVYAEGEAALAWLNATASISAGVPISIDGLLTDLGSRLRASLAAEGTEIAHVKVSGQAQGAVAVVSVIGAGRTPELAVPSDASSARLNVIINARVVVEPERLEGSVREALAGVCGERGATVRVTSLERFRPSRPTPTHRTGKEDLRG